MEMMLEATVYIFYVIIADVYKSETRLHFQLSEYKQEDSLIANYYICSLAYIVVI